MRKDFVKFTVELSDFDQQAPFYSLHSLQVLEDGVATLRVKSTCLFDRSIIPSACRGATVSNYGVTLTLPDSQQCFNVYW